METKKCVKCGKKGRTYFEYNDKTGEADLPIIMCEICWVKECIDKLEKGGEHRAAERLRIQYGLKK